MKKIWIVFVSLLIVLVAGAILFFGKPKQQTATEVATTAAAVNPQVSSEISADEVKRLMTTLSWNTGLSDWSRSLEVNNCTETECAVKVIFSTPQICPKEAKEDEWCDETELTGRIQFINNGFNFVDEKNSNPVFCQIKADTTPGYWKIEGANCPTDLTQLPGTKSN